MSKHKNELLEEPKAIVIDQFREPLKVGETIQITPASENSSPPKYFVKYLGGLDKASLICTMPTVDEKILLVKENAVFSASLFSGKHVYRFNTIVEAVMSKPYPHMHLKFPREIFTSLLRKNQRISTNIIASMRNKTATEHAEKLFTGRMLDLSMGGAMIEAKQLAGNIDDIIECSFRLNIAGDNTTFMHSSLLCKIIEPNEKDREKDVEKNYKFALQFNELNAQNKAILSSFIFQSLTGARLDDL
jgi:c-di-GMP-binding flagellar brake protein YcgR